jgi:hypothetical protein
MSKDKDKVKVKVKDKDEVKSQKSKHKHNRKHNRKHKGQTQKTKDKSEKVKDKRQKTKNTHSALCFIPWYLCVGLAGPLCRCVVLVFTGLSRYGTPPQCRAGVYRQSVTASTTG